MSIRSMNSALTRRVEDLEGKIDEITCRIGRINDLEGKVNEATYDVPRALLLFARLRGLFARPRFEISDL